MKLTVGKKLTAGFGLVLVVMSISGILVTVQLKAIEKNLSDIVDKETPKNVAGYEMEINLVGTGFGLLGYLEDRDQEHLSRIRRDKEDFYEFQKIFRQLSETVRSKDLSIQIGAKYDTYIKLADSLVTLQNEQDQKVVTLFDNHELMDALLDDKLQPAILSDVVNVGTKLVPVMELEININGIAKGLGEYLRMRDSRYEARVMKDETDFGHFARQLQATSLSQNEKVWMQELEQLFQESVMLTGEIIQLDKVMNNQRTEFIRERREMDELLDEGIQKITMESVLLADSEAANSIQTTITLALLLLFFGLFVGAGSAIYIYRNIINSIRTLADTARRISSGDMTARVAITSQDEIGELAVTFNQMASNLNDAKVEIEAQRDMLGDEVSKRTSELELSSKNLEIAVTKRTEELQSSKFDLEEKVKELEDFYDATIDRELKIEEMRKRIQELEASSR